MSRRSFKRPAVKKTGRNRNRAVKPSLNVGRRQELTLTGFSHDGRGICRSEGKTIFVEGALAGEQVVAATVQEHSRYIDARAVEILKPSPKRGEPSCKHYKSCGGCNLQHVQSTEQLALKESAVLDQFQRWSGLTPARILPALASPTQGYRQRARLAVWYNDSGVVELGFRQANSKQLVDVLDCSVLDSRLNSLLSPLRGWLQDAKGSRAVTHIELLVTDNEVAVIIRHTRKLTESYISSLQSLAMANDCQIWLKPGSERELFDLSGNPCDPRLNYQLPCQDESQQQLNIGFHPTDFTQVNSDINRAMVNQAIELLQLCSTDRVLDLFCGVGNFTLPIALQAAEVIGVEGAESMVVRGRENAESNDLGNCQFVAANLEADVAKLAWAKTPVDAVLLDPPRAGAKGAMNWLEQLSAKRVVYVSCNPATLARDAKSLAAMGYKLDALGVMDMFPQTAHIESMALFTKS